MKKYGYTLIEVMVASFISVLVIGGVSTSLAHILRTWRETQVISDLNMSLELAMEHMRKDMRLSSVGVGLMSFYPATSAKYTAISFPMADDLDNDGLLDRNAEGKIEWTKTVIYHIMATSPNEFRRTIFSPRDTSASSQDLYTQLSTVALAMSDATIESASLSGESSNSRTVFKNLTKLAFFPPKSMFDGYSPSRKRGSTFNFGSIVLAPGFHTLEFTVTGKNDDSSGYDIEVDKFRLGRARGSLEAEAFMPINSHPKAPLFSYSTSAGTAVAEDMSTYGVQWSGRAQAKFNASGVGSQIDFDIYDDMWCDNNFNDPGAQVSSNCSVKFDTSFKSIAPYIGDKVVSMDKGIAWTASSCGDTIQTIPVTSTTTVWNAIYGGSAVDDISISMNGCWTRVSFERPNGYAMHLDDAKILDNITGISAPITFNNGSSSIIVPITGPSIITSDWVEMWEIDRQQPYYVYFRSIDQGGADPSGLVCWENSDNIPLSQINGGAWTNFTAGIHSVEVGYPKEAIYRSGVFDTRTDMPTFKKLYWTEIQKYSEGGDVDIRVRSANNQDMSDGNWLSANPSSDGYFQNNDGSISLMQKKRYIQYEAIFRCGHGGHTEAHTNEPTAILRDVSIMWEPPLGLVDLEVDFGMGPDCGIVEATVDGKPFAKSMVVELEIYKEGPRSLQTVHARTEIRPLNTGK